MKKMLARKYVVNQPDGSRTIHEHVINLRSDEGHPMTITRIAPTSEVIDRQRMTYEVWTIPD